MGEYADMAIDDMLSMDEYEFLHPEEFEGEPSDQWGTFRRGPRPKTCKYCGKKGLFWGKQENGQWRLEDYSPEENEFFVHSCKERNSWKFNTNTETSLIQKQNT